MIKLRLQRKGRKKRPFYHIVVADSRSPRDGRIIERLGRFDNVSEKKELTYDEERVIHWLKIGAQPSDTVRSILKKEGILYKMHLIRWGKSEEEIEAALEEWRAAKEAKYGDDTVSRKKKQAELLKAEEKEYKKQLEEKAAAAAKELEKKKLEEEAAKAEQEAKEAEEKAEKEAAAKAKEAEEPVKEEASEEKAEEKAPEEEEKAAAPKEDDSEEKEVKAEEADAEEEEPAAETAPEEEKEEKPEAEVEAKEEKEEKPEAEVEAKEEKEEKPEAEVEAKKEKEEEKSSVSTDMNANEAIDHIKNSSLEELEGFVPENEDRVTVQRAWESKQADAE